MIIFSPGPANISERVRKALTLPDICHRDEEFTRILNETRKYILDVCGVKDGYKSIVYTGSGTAAIESAISSLTGVIKKLAIISNGVYGKRAQEVAEVFGVEKDVFSSPIDKLPDISKLEGFLKSSNAEAVYLVHHETTTGLLNPLKEIAAISKKYGKYVLVDGVSSIAGEELNLKSWGIDLIIGSANKCIRGVPGLSFIVAEEGFLSKLKSRKRVVYYLDLIDHLEREEKGETPFTPAVQTFFAFREALLETLEEGVQNRIAHYKKIAKKLRTGLKELGLTILVPEEILSNTMTTVALPSGKTFEELHSKCKKKGFVVYNSMGELKGKTFRLGTVGLIIEKDISNFIPVLKEAIK
jgi:2-aminoethylphosphonate-pyruvate transaminase